MSGTPVLIPADVRFPLERANGVQIVKTAAALARSGTPTTLFVRQSDPRPTPEILRLYGVDGAPDLDVRRVRVLHRRGSFLVPRLAFLGRAVATAARAARRGAIVYTRDLQLADLLLRVPGTARRVVYEAHAVESVMYEERGLLYGTAAEVDPGKTARLRQRESRVWRRAGGFLATTAGIRDSFAASFGPREADVIPNGCDVPDDRTFPGLPEGEPRILYAGQLYPWKGVDVLVEAMARLGRGRLVILGGMPGEGDTERVRALVDRVGLTARTEMPGLVPQAEVAAELRRATIVVVPFLRSAMTERHTSPLKAFEAMAAGRAIVASDLPSTREVLRHGETAWLVPPGDAAALAFGLTRLLDDRAGAGRLARGAWDEAPRYSWDARARRLRAAFERMR